MTITLRPYQSEMVAGVYREWSAGNRNVLGVLSTGGGKSLIISQIASDRDAQGANQCIMAHRTELVSQMSMHVANRGIKHRIIAPTGVIRQITNDHRAAFNGRSFVSPDARCVVAAAQTLVARADSLVEWGKQVHNWTVDECFPAGTLVSTPGGDVPIEALSEGDPVVCFSESTETFHVRPVTHLFKNQAPSKMVRLTRVGHHVTEATYGHPFWTVRGWVAAGDLTVHDWILADVPVQLLWRGNTDHFRITALPVQKAWNDFLPTDSLWDEVQGSEPNALLAAPCTAEKTADGGCLSHLLERYGADQEPSENTISQNWSRVLQPGMLAEICFKNVVFDNGANKQGLCVRAHDKSQSNETTRNSRESFTIIDCDGSQTNCSRWQWQANPRSRTNVTTPAGTLRVCASICDTYGDTERLWFSNMLQTGYGAPCLEDFGRSRRKVSCAAKTARSRQEEGRIFVYQRLASVEIYEQADNGRPDGSFVYNIEVDEHSTYTANGIVVHNCHHLARGNLWNRAVDLFPNAYGLGVTATPERLDGLGLGRHADGLMDAMILGPSMRDLIAEGSLCEYQIAIPQSDFSIGDDALTAGGDYSRTKMRDATKSSHLVGDVVAEYSKHAYGKRAICFATDVESSNEIAALFNAAGIPAASVSAKTDSAVRSDYVRRFRDGKLWVLVNVDLFDEGFDIPGCEVVIMARPTASLGKYLQMFGRALRPAPNKPHGLIIDHVSNWKRHGFPDKPRQWSLDRREKRAKREKDPEEIELTACQGCSRPYERLHPACPYCGWEPPLSAVARRSIEQVDGDLLLLDADVLAQMRAAAVLESPASVQERVEQAAGPLAGKAQYGHAVERHLAQQRLSASIAQWAGIQRAKGRPDQSSYRRFYLTTGVDVLTALTGSRAEMEKLAERVESWYEQ